jgi:hypothetical protein
VTESDNDGTTVSYEDTSSYEAAGEEGRTTCTFVPVRGRGTGGGRTYRYVRVRRLPYKVQYRVHVDLS